VFDEPVTCYVEGLFNTKLQPLVKHETENKCVQQSKEIEKCAYDNSEENEEGFESGERTLPLCFASFKLLKQDVNNVLDQEPSIYDVEYPKCSGLANESHLPLCFFLFELLKENHEITEEAGKYDCNGTSLYGQIVINKEDQQTSHTVDDILVDYIDSHFGSDLWPALNYQLENEYEVDQEIAIEGHFPSPKLNVDIQQDFQQDRVFQSCLSSPENDVVVQFLNGLYIDEDYENAYMETSSSEQRTNIEFQESNKTVYGTFQSKLFDEQEDIIYTHSMVVIFEEVKRCMNVFVEVHGMVDKPIATISFENTLRIK
jgi:hypothetical protein